MMVASCVMGGTLAGSATDFVMAPENYHPIEYQLFYMNLRRNAQERAEAYLRHSKE